MSSVSVDQLTRTVVGWVETNIGPVQAVRTQPRWRPQLFLDVDTGDTVKTIVVRGDRVDTALVWPLRHEMTVCDVMHRHGIRAPEVYGWIDEAGAYALECIPGVPTFADATDDVRDRVVDEYLQQLAVLHRLDIGPFVEAGVDRAATPDESGLLGIRRFEAMYRAQKAHADPFGEFALGWVRRHPPRSGGRESAVVWDSGQFHHDGGHLTGLLDLELGHVGDPMMDLAGWRMRDSIVGFGEFAKLYDRYSELTGEPVDVDAVELHHIFFTLTNHLSFQHVVRDPTPGSDFATNLQWCNETNLYATEAIGDFIGVELPTVEPLPSRRSKVANAHAHLVRNLREMQQATNDEFLRHHLRISFRLARHLARVDEIGDAAVEADLDDVHRLLGHRPGSWFEGEEELERYILADAGDGAHDEALVSLLHRRNLRAQMLNGPEGSAMARHIPIQGFR